MSIKTINFVCSSCGSIFQRWQGKCEACNQWNTIVEAYDAPKKGSSSRSSKIVSKPIQINEIKIDHQEKLPSGLSELDFVLGGGLSASSVVLLGGEPGIGKSTLALQVAFNVSQSRKVLYISGEESLSQINARAMRLGALTDQLYVLSETNIQVILEHMKALSPDLIVLDSIQVVYDPDMPSISGSVNQVRYCTGLLVDELKASGKIGIVIGHITKDGSLAGPKILEHIVDVILYLEGERSENLRILRSFKNRFHSTNDIGLFELKSFGLESLNSPSSVFFHREGQIFAGSVVSCICDSSRGLLIEIQSLVHTSGYGAGKRTFLGVDVNRVALIITALEKLVGLKLFDKDIIINIVSGIKSNDPALDLAIVFSIMSSLLNSPFNRNFGVLGEISLTGELRPVKQADKRVLEFYRMGLPGCVLPKKNAINSVDLGLGDFKIIEVSHLSEAIHLFFDF